MNGSPLSVLEALTARNPRMTQGQAAALTMEGLVLVNGLRARHPDQLVRVGDVVTVAGVLTPA